MRFSDSFLDDIRNRLDISDIVGQHVVWDKRKSQPARGDYWANCPFHGEKTPSFHADNRRGRYHCFGCGASGDHFRFLTEKTGMPFPEAVEMLAGRAGIAMPARDAREEQQDRERRDLYGVMELAQGYFEQALQANVGARARGYVIERGLTPSIQKQFGLGYAPDSRNGLKEYLASQGVSAEQMIATGMVIHGEQVAVPYDRFRDRLMFPIQDLRGRTIAFGGRALSADAQAKYLNSPETDLFHKRAMLYNAKPARQAAYDGAQLIVVEGYMDVIACVAAGFHGAVAPLGTALTQDQITLLWRMGPEPILCFDGDEAGQRASFRSSEILLPMLKAGYSAKFAHLPQGQDPDDLIRDEGRDALASVLNAALPLSELVWSRHTSEGVPQTPEKRASLENTLRTAAQTIVDENVRRHYQDSFREKLRNFFAPIYQRARNNSYGGPRTNARPGGYGGSQGNDWSRGKANAGGKVVLGASLAASPLLKGGSVTPMDREAVLILTLVNHPELIETHLEKVAELEIGNKALEKVRAGMVDLVASEPVDEETDLRAKLVVLGHGEVIEKIEIQLGGLGIWQMGKNIASKDAETGWLHAVALHYKLVQLNKELKAAELALGNDPSEESFERLRDIQNQLAAHEGTEALIEGFGSLSGRAVRAF